MSVLPVALLGALAVCSAFSPEERAPHASITVPARPGVPTLRVSASVGSASSFLLSVEFLDGAEAAEAAEAADVEEACDGSCIVEVLNALVFKASFFLSLTNRKRFLIQNDLLIFYKKLNSFISRFCLFLFSNKNPSRSKQTANFERKLRIR